VSQQINLFNPIFLKRKKYFSAVTMLQGLALVLAGSIVVAVYARIQLAEMRSDADGSAQRLKQAQAQLAQVSAAYAPRQKNKALEEEIQRLEAELKSQKQAYDIVQRGGIGNTRGYSEYLKAFARQIVNGLWLTDFTINGAGTDVELRGRAIQPELVPAYLTRLKQEPIMKGKSFAALEMDVPEAESVSKPIPSSTESSAASAPQRTLAPYIRFTLKSSGIVAEQSGDGDTAAGDAVKNLEGAKQ
jgi:hypothetical protein